MATKTFTIDALIISACQFTIDGLIKAPKTDITLNIYSDKLGDGQSLNDDSTWNGARNAANADSVNNSATFGSYVEVGNTSGGANFRIARGHLTFDTSVLPEGAILTVGNTKQAVRVYFNVGWYQDTDPVYALIDLMQSTQANGNALVVGDFSALGTLLSSGYSVAPATGAGNFNFYISTSRYGDINFSGYSKYVLRWTFDRVDHQIPALKDDARIFVARDYGGVAFTPRMTITYQLPENRHLDQKQQTYNYALAIGRTTQTVLAQTFRPQVTAELKSIATYFRYVGNPTDSVTIKIYEDGGTVPGALLATCTKNINAASLNEVDATRVDVAFPAGTILIEGTKYWFVVERTGALDDTNYYQGFCNSVDIYSRGEFHYNNGTSWLTSATISDFWFEEYYLGGVSIGFKTFTADGVVFAQNTLSFTVDGRIIERGTPTFTTDGWIIQRFTKSFTVDAMIGLVGYFIGSTLMPRPNALTRENIYIAKDVSTISGKGGRDITNMKERITLSWNRLSASDFRAILLEIEKNEPLVFYVNQNALQISNMLVIPVIKTAEYTTLGSDYLVSTSIELTEVQ